MGKRHKLRDAPEAAVVALVNEGGQSSAAKAYGVTQSAISLWLKARGYVAKVVYVKANHEEKAS